MKNNHERMGRLKDLDWEKVFAKDQAPSSFVSFDK